METLPNEDELQNSTSDGTILDKPSTLEETPIMENDAEIVQIKNPQGRKQYPITSSAAVGMSDGSGNLNSTLSKIKGDKQDKLVSGTNIKSLNDESIVGNGNIEVQNLIDKRLTDFRTYGRKKGSFVEVPTKAEFNKMKQFFLDLFIEQGLLTDATSSAITNRSIFRNGLSLTNN